MERNRNLEATKIFLDAVKKFVNKNTDLNAADGLAAMTEGLGSAIAFMLVHLNSTDERGLDAILQCVGISARANLKDWRDSHPHPPEVESPWTGSRDE